ncbi:MAG TPA: hypothetical protein VIB60_02550 [Methylomirabilota bacterium]
MSASRRPLTRRLLPAALLLGLVAVALGGCWVVPAPPPSAGLPPVPPPYVRATPQCGWAYGPGWYGWGWYGNC